MLAGLKIISVEWASQKPALMRLREQVFINEQHVPPALEWDEYDASAQHLLAICQGHPIACARIVENRIGRMAVLKPWRHQGVGKVLLDGAIQAVRQAGFSEAMLSAQVHAIGFYQRAGFVVSSGEYLDAGITHVDMVLAW
jgi:predicted GNAT family N-acyltransferase